MTSNLKVSGKARIKAVIDHTNKVVENDEKNNAMKKTLTCRRFHERPHDRGDRPRHRIRPSEVSRRDVGREDCISFNPQTAMVKKIQGSWKIVDGSHWMFDFGGKKKEAKKALKIIKKYQMNQSCFVGRPSPVLWAARIPLFNICCQEGTRRRVPLRVRTVSLLILKQRALSRLKGGGKSWTVATGCLTSEAMKMKQEKLWRLSRNTALPGRAL